MLFQAKLPQLFLAEV